jgi:peroxiredoxin
MNFAAFRLALPAALLLSNLSGCADEDAAACGEVTAVPRTTYPAAPYGTAAGTTLANLSFADPDGTSTVDLQSLRAAGDKRLLLVITSAGWCSACIEEQPELNRLYNTYKDCGLEVLLTVFEDDQTYPATPALAAQWKSSYSNTFPVVADAPFVLKEYYDESYTPMVMFVDLETMEILSIATGQVDAATEAFIRQQLAE